MPVAPEPPGGNSGTKPAPARESRSEILNKNGVSDPEMPSCDALYLVDYLFEVGPVASSGMGPVPLSHAEISAWQHNTGIALDAWEARTLRALSLIYLGESQRATALDHPAPWADAPYARLHVKVKAAATQAAIRGLAKL